MISNERTMDKGFFVLLVYLGGMMGLDRFMRGQTVLGILKMITLGGFGIWYIIDACIAAYKAPVYPEKVVFVDGKWVE